MGYRRAVPQRARDLTRTEDLPYRARQRHCDLRDPEGLLLVGTGMSREDHRTQKPATHSRVSTDVIVVGPEARS